VSDGQDASADGELFDRVRELIRSRVEWGLDAPERIVEIACLEAFQPGDVDPDWAREEVAATIEAKRIAESAWPETLDTDRLDAAFAELRGRGVLCFHDLGVSHDDPVHEAQRAWKKAGGAPSGSDGWCAYSRRGVEDAAAGRGLALAFGSFTSPEQAIKVGRRIEHRMQAAGFDVVWDGDPAKRIVLRDFDIRRRGMPVQAI
jgi:hypothetical protein